MSFLDRLFGRDRTAEPQQPARGYEGDQFGEGSEPLTDEQAIQRYRYMLRSAPPETIEQAHAEAFAQLTPSQRARVLSELSAALPANERVAAGQDYPRTSRAWRRGPSCGSRARWSAHSAAWAG